MIKRSKTSDYKMNDRIFLQNPDGTIMEASALKVPVKGIIDVAVETYQTHKNIFLWCLFTELIFVSTFQIVFYLKRD